MFMHFLRTMVASVLALTVLSLTAWLVYSFFSGVKIDTGQGDGTILIDAFVVYVLPIFQIVFLAALLVADYFALKYWHRTCFSSNDAA